MYEAYLKLPVSVRRPTVCPPALRAVRGRQSLGISRSKPPGSAHATQSSRQTKVPGSPSRAQDRRSLMCLCPAPQGQLDTEPRPFVSLALLPHLGREGQSEMTPETLYSCTTYPCKNAVSASALITDPVN